MENILVVDDNQDNLDLISLMLERNGFGHVTALSGMEALVKMEKEPFRLVISDLMMPQMNGIQLLEKVKESWPETEVIIVTSVGIVKPAVEAMKKGAYSYIQRPFDDDDLVLEVKKVLDYVNMRKENTSLREELDQVRHGNLMIGNTPLIRAIQELIGSVANTNATVLIMGESGTGKELVANALHNASGRKRGPFVKVNCAALAESLLESELFGHEKGAFTGAIAQKKGRFEMADGGTLFLDEIGDISPAIQVKLLRVLQEREFDRVGGAKPVKTDVRIVSATNKNLAEEVKRGRFREDLFYRLNVISVNMPALRERKDDIAELARYFLEKYKADVNKNIAGITDKAMRALVNYDWPGNIRELQNVIERAVVLANRPMLDLADLPDNISKGPQRISIAAGEALPTLKEAKHLFEKQYLEKALLMHKGNISRTAEKIELARKNLQDKIKTYEIDIDRLLEGKAEEG
ncbi:MAG: sigma-54-dependent Fis family transcriptional regulator [Nitrospinae bacterium]|nr:sigma-54-dependent Fis family transcriptional regulator [Nitrospinota bacterium]